jgi:hypothetical protein
VLDRRVSFEEQQDGALGVEPAPATHQRIRLGGLAGETDQSRRSRQEDEVGPQRGDRRLEGSGLGKGAQLELLLGGALGVAPRGHDSPRRQRVDHDERDR